jgi:hypothetical protein
MHATAPRAAAVVIRDIKRALRFIFLFPQF